MRYHEPMASTTTLVSAEEFLATSYKPACEYRDGVLHQKSMPTRKHSLLQLRIAQLILQLFPEFEPAPELTVQIRKGRFLVPDIAVQDRRKLQDPYPLEPVHLCVEILSPTDRMSETLAKCEEYHGWGVQTTWIADPEERRCWEYRAGHRPVEIPTGGKLTADPIAIPVDDIFTVLDTLVPEPTTRA